MEEFRNALLRTIGEKRWNHVFLSIVYVFFSGLPLLDHSISFLYLHVDDLPLSQET
jgi:hypothetical protein